MFGSPVRRFFHLVRKFQACENKMSYYVRKIVHVLVIKIVYYIILNVIILEMIENHL